MKDFINCNIKHSTNYYRKNKTKRKIVHKCPHCEYETTGPKSSMQAHIWSKHTPENERPFQCYMEGCCKGFAQKINFQRHLKKKHNIDVELKKNTQIAEYHITLTNVQPIAKKINHRINFYRLNPIIYPHHLNNILPGTTDQIIKSNHLYYDSREGYIKLKTISYDELNKRPVKKINVKFKKQIPKKIKVMKVRKKLKFLK